MIDDKLKANIAASFVEMIEKEMEQDYNRCPESWAEQGVMSPDDLGSYPQCRLEGNWPLRWNQFGEKFIDEIEKAFYERYPKKNYGDFE